MLTFLEKIFGRSQPPSKTIVKERLRLVLMHDRGSTLDPQLLGNLKEEIIEVMSKYIEIDRTESEVNLDKSEDTVALVANISVRNIKRENLR